MKSLLINQYGYKMRSFLYMKVTKHDPLALKHIIHPHINTILRSSLRTGCKL